MKPQEQERVLSALQSAIEAIRHSAVRRLAEFEHLPLAPALTALGDSSWRVRKAAAEVLVAVRPTPELLAGLLACLRSEDNAGLRNAATETLVRIGLPAAPALLGALGDPDHDVRKFAADVLGEIGSTVAPVVTDSLIGLLGDTDGNVRAAAAEALGRIGDPRATPALIQALTHGELQLQISAMDALEHLGAEVPWEALRGLTEVRALRAQLCRLLARSLAPEALDTLLEGLAARGKVERSSAAQALAQRWLRSEAAGREALQTALAARATPELLTRLRELLAGSELAEREAAVRLLGLSGQHEVLDDLGAAAADPALREAVQDAVMGMGSEAAGKWLERLDLMGREALILGLELLSAFGLTESLPRVVELCLHADPTVAGAAQRTLGELGSPAAVTALVGLLGREGSEGSRAAVSGLVQLAERRYDEVRAALLPLLSEGPDAVRSDAADCLCRIARQDDLPRLHSLLGDAEGRVRARAVEAIARLGGQGAVDRLRSALADEQAEVRAAAARALGGRSGAEAGAALRAALADGDAWVVREALAGLTPGVCELGPDPVVPFLDKPEGAVALEAVRALHRLGWGTHQQAWLQACRHADAEVAKEALRAAEHWPAPVVQIAVTVALGDARWDVRMAAVRLAGSTRDPLLRQAVAARLPQEQDALVREAMVQALRPEGGPVPHG